MRLSGEKAIFLESGGTLLKVTKSRKGQYIIKQMDKTNNWVERITCDSAEIAIGLVSKLIEKHPEKFQKFEK